MTEAIALALIRLLTEAFNVARSSSSEADKVARIERAAIALAGEQATERIADEILSRT